MQAIVLKKVLYRLRTACISNRLSILRSDIIAHIQFPLVFHQGLRIRWSDEDLCCIATCHFDHGLLVFLKLKLKDGCTKIKIPHQRQFVRTNHSFSDFVQINLSRLAFYTTDPASEVFRPRPTKPPEQGYQDAENKAPKQYEQPERWRRWRRRRRGGLAQTQSNSAFPLYIVICANQIDLQLSRLLVDQSFSAEKRAILLGHYNLVSRTNWVPIHQEGDERLNLRAIASGWGNLRRPIEECSFKIDPFARIVQRVLWRRD